MAKKWRSRQLVSFEVEEQELTVVIRLGNPLTFCEIYDATDGGMLAYGVSNCREEGWQSFSLSTGGRGSLSGQVFTSRPGYDPVKGAKLALKSAINKFFPYYDNSELRDTIYKARTAVWDAWKSVFLEEEKTEDGDTLVEQ